MKFLFYNLESDLSDEHSEILPLLTQCEDFSTTINSGRSSDRRNGSASLSFKNNIPPKATCDQLVQLYLRTFGSVFRILHVPSFQQEYQAYWNNAPGSNDAFYQKLLLVMAIGTCFYHESEDNERSLRSLASKWIYDVQQWLGHVFEMFEIDVDALQVSCLLLLAQQTDTVGSDLIWISADFPLRIAINLGIHKEPSVHFPEMPLFEAEMSKRLWATVLEISVQSCLDSGIPPSISREDFDCQPPANLNDIQIGENLENHLPEEPLGTFTQSSIQIMLTRTVSMRLKIAQSLNALTSSSTYQETLKGGSELESACRSHTALIQSYLSASSTDGTKPSEFQIKLLDILTRRFLLALHGPFAARAKSDPSFYFSRKVVAETSLLLLSYPLSPQRHSPSTQDDDYSRLMALGGGIFKHALWHATATICVELINDLTEDAFPFTHGFSRKRFCQAIQDSIDVLGRRIGAGDTSVKAYVLFSCALAQIYAIQAGTAPEKRIADAAKASLGFCCRLLEAQAGDSGQQQFSRASTSHADTGFQGINDELTSWDLMVSQTECPSHFAHTCQ